ncbi:uncharacterized protein LOC127102929 [Lathyrus oleraceus]|uniref:uncharacterized protein LOC127102929 n=1 Tax=Pisum sativum TaxID=3888 RepID=UPI0021D3500C|nr:uncharacterized protein LOC127102929 [Pisum sativum]
MNSTEQAPSSSHQNPTVTDVVSTPIYKEPHILDSEPHIHLATPFEKLEVLYETLVDFDSMKRNGVDLTDELKKQGWEHYFQRLYGPVYTNPVKEFWRFTDSDDHYIVSYVLGVKIVITEKSIATLLNMKKTGGRRIYNINPRAKYLSHEINPTIFQQNVKEAEMLNETTSPSSSPSPQSPPYYNLSSDTEPFDPHSPTLAQIQNRALSPQQPTHSNPEPEVTSPPPENPNTTTSEPPPSEPIHSESQPSQPLHSEMPQPTTSADPTPPTLNLSPPSLPPKPLN